MRRLPTIESGTLYYEALDGRERGCVPVRTCDWGSRAERSGPCGSSTTGSPCASRSVTDLRRLAVPRLTFEALADVSALKRSDQVRTVGYPDGKPWFTRVSPDYLSGLSADEIRFESAYLSQGHSGGAVVNERWELVGMIKADQPPEGLAVPLDRIVDRLRRWNYPVQLARRTTGVAGGPARPSDDGAGATTATSIETSATALLKRFLDPSADRPQLTRELRPTPQDYRRVFTPAFSAQAEAHYASLWDGGDAVVAPNAGQTALLVSTASSEDAKAWNARAAQTFPGGWKEMGPHLQPGVTWVSFKFVKPGETLGMAYDGLVLIDGRWRLFPKPYRVPR